MIESAKPCVNPDCPNGASATRIFYSRPTGGPHSRCRDCHRVQSASRYRANRDEACEKSRAYRQRNLEHLRAHDRDRYMARRGTQAAYLREWKKRNRDKVDAYDAARRAKVRIATEPIDRHYIYDREGGVCHICGKAVPRGDFTLDHLVPLARGGEHTAANLRLAHRPCNSRMGVARLPAQLLLVA